MYENNFRDGFRQLVVDYIHGLQTLDVFKVRDDDMNTPDRSTTQSVTVEHNDASKPMTDCTLPHFYFHS
jgi:hypothetical protein